MRGHPRTGVALTEDLSATAEPLDHVPTVLVNSSLYEGNTNEVERIRTF